MAALPSHEAFRGITNFKALNQAQQIEFQHILESRVEWQTKVERELKQHEEVLAVESSAVFAKHFLHIEELKSRVEPYIVEVDPSQAESVIGHEHDMINSTDTFVDDSKTTQALIEMCNHLANKWALVDPSDAGEYKATTDKVIETWTKPQQVSDCVYLSKDCPTDLRSAYRIAQQQNELIILWSLARAMGECDLAALAEHAESMMDKEDDDDDFSVDGVIRYWESLERISYYRQRTLDMLEKCSSEILRKRYPSEEQQVARHQSWLKWCETTLQQA